LGITALTALRFEGEALNLSNQHMQITLIEIRAGPILFHFNKQ